MYPYFLIYIIIFILNIYIYNKNSDTQQTISGYFMTLNNYQCKCFYPILKNPITTLSEM